MAIGVLRAHSVAGGLAVAGVVVFVPSASGDWVGAVLVLVLSYGCGAYTSPVKGGSAVAAMIIAMQVAMGFSEFPNVEILFPTLVPYWAGREVGLRNALVRRLAQRTAELHAKQAAFAELSVQRERARIARELHDIVRTTSRWLSSKLARAEWPGSARANERRNASMPSAKVVDKR